LVPAFGTGLPLGAGVETFILREDAERFIEEVRGDEPEVAAKLRIEERKLEADGLDVRARRIRCWSTPRAQVAFVALTW
jgi:hypothetical protein